MSRYIDAEKLITACLHFEEIHREHADYKEANKYRIIREAVQGAPTADVEEVRHGEWVATPIRYCRRNTNHKKYHCSECGKDVGNRPNYKRCPECGAKMDGGTK